jgi:hypothetical protein
MEAKKKPAKSDKTEQNICDFAVGDRAKVNMHRGRIVDATIKFEMSKNNRAVVALQIRSSRIHAVIQAIQNKR